MFIFICLCSHLTRAKTIKLITILKDIVKSKSNSHYDTWISEKKKSRYSILLGIRYLIHHHEENFQVPYDDIL